MTTWEDRVRRIEEAVAVWRPLLLDPQTPKPGSSLAKDDETFPPMPCSQIAWWGLSVATEHLDAGLRLLSDQTARGGPFFSEANYTVQRAALLGASQAAALLLPPRRETRTTYGLQLAHEQFRRARNIREHLQSLDGLPEPARGVAAEAEFLASLSGPLDRAAGILDERMARKSFPDTDMVKAAAELVHHQGPDARLLQLGQEMEWRLGSGSAHGQLLVSMHRAGGHRRDGNLAMFVGNYDDIAQAISRVALITSAAWHGWDRRWRH